MAYQNIALDQMQALISKLPSLTLDQKVQLANQIQKQGIGNQLRGDLPELNRYLEMTLGQVYQSMQEKAGRIGQDMSASGSTTSRFPNLEAEIKQYADLIPQWTQGLESVFQLPQTPAQQVTDMPAITTPGGTQGAQGQPSGGPTGITFPGDPGQVFGEPTGGTGFAAQPAAQRQRATLINPTTGHRIAVDVGSQEAQQYFGQGYKLEGAGQAPDVSATIVSPTGQRQQVDTAAQAQQQFAQGAVLEEKPPDIPATLVKPGAAPVVTQTAQQAQQAFGQGFNLPGTTQDQAAQAGGLGTTPPQLPSGTPPVPANAPVPPTSAAGQFAPPATTPATPGATGEGGEAGGAGTEVDLSKPGSLQDFITQQNQALLAEFQRLQGETTAQQNALLEQIQNQPSQVDLLTQLRTEQGLPQLDKAVAAVDRQILDTEELLSKLEGDIGVRVEGFPVTDAARRRLLAREQKPLTEQMSDLIRGRTRLEVGRTAKERLIQQLAEATQADTQRGIQAAQLGTQFAGQRAETGMDLFTTFQSRALTGFTTERADELKDLRDEREATQKLTAAKQKRLEELQDMEIKFQDSLTLAREREQATLERQISLEAFKSQIQPLKTSDIQTFVDTGGNVTAVNKATGETLWTAPGIGRAGSASPNITVSPIADPVTGTVQYIEVRDKDTGKVTYKDARTGEEVDPSKVQIDEPQDPLDRIISDALEGIEF